MTPSRRSQRRTNSRPAYEVRPARSYRNVSCPLTRARNSAFRRRTGSGLSFGGRVGGVVAPFLPQREALSASGGRSGRRLFCHIKAKYGWCFVHWQRRYAYLSAIMVAMDILEALDDETL